MDDTSSNSPSDIDVSLAGNINAKDTFTGYPIFLYFQTIDFPETHLIASSTATLLSVSRRMVVTPKAAMRGLAART